MSYGSPSSEGPNLRDFLPLVNGTCAGLFGASAIFNFASGNTTGGIINAGLTAMWLGIGVMNTYTNYNYNHLTP